MVDDTGLIFNRIGEQIQQQLNLCIVDLHELFYWFFLPLIIGLIIILILIFKKRLKELFDRFLLKRGWVKIIHIGQNKNINVKLIKLDKYSSFTFRKRRYTLNKMNEFFIGYSKGSPVYIFSENFVLPLIIDKDNIKESLIKSFKDSGIEVNNNKIESLSLKIDSEVLEEVYKRKLISDLYSISKGELEFKKIALYIGAGILLFIILYYTGLLEKILGFLGFSLN